MYRSVVPVGVGVPARPLGFRILIGRRFFTASRFRMTDRWGFVIPSGGEESPTDQTPERKNPSR